MPSRENVPFSAMLFILCAVVAALSMPRWADNMSGAMGGLLNAATGTRAGIPVNLDFAGGTVVHLHIGSLSAGLPYINTLVSAIPGKPCLRTASSSA